HCGDCPLNRAKKPRPWQPIRCDCWPRRSSSACCFAAVSSRRLTCSARAGSTPAPRSNEASWLSSRRQAWLRAGALGGGETVGAPYCAAAGAAHRTSAGSKAPGRRKNFAIPAQVMNRNPPRRSTMERRNGGQSVKKAPCPAASGRYRNLMATLWAVAAGLRRSRRLRLDWPDPAGLVAEIPQDAADDEAGAQEYEDVQRLVGEPTAPPPHHRKPHEIKPPHPP